MQFYTVCIFIMTALIMSLSPISSAAKDLATSPNDPIHIESDSLLVRQEDGLAIFEGKVKAVQGNMQLYANEMTVYYTNAQEKKATGSELKKITVFGDVKLVTPGETAKAKNGSYNILKDEIELRGSVVLTQGQNILRGNRLVHNIKTGRSKLLSTTRKGKKAGRVKGVFIPKSMK